MLGRSSRNVYRNVLSSCSPFVLRNAPSSRVHGKRPHLIIRLLASTPGPNTNRESSTINLKSVEEEAYIVFERHRRGACWGGSELFSPLGPKSEELWQIIVTFTLHVCAPLSLSNQHVPNKHNSSRTEGSPDVMSIINKFVPCTPTRFSIPAATTIHLDSSPANLSRLLSTGCVVVVLRMEIARHGASSSSSEIIDYLFKPTLHMQILITSKCGCVCEEHKL